MINFSLIEERIGDMVSKNLQEKTEKIIHTNKYIIQMQDEGIHEFFMQDPERFFEVLIKSIKHFVTEFNLPINVEKTKIVIDAAYFVVDKMRKLPASSINKTVCFDAHVVGEGQKHSYIKSFVSRCPKCTDTITTNNPFKFEGPTCVNCNKKCDIIAQTVQYGELKNVILQEPIENTIDGMPCEYNAIVRDLNINDVYVGAKLRVIAKYGIILQKENRHPFQLEIYSVEHLGDSKDVSATKEEISNYYLESKKAEFEQNLIDSFAPDIFCSPKSTLWFVKYSIMLFLATGNNIENKRQFLNMFICGDPGVAKSSMMKFAISISPRSLYISGNGASEAGLTAVIEKQADGKFIAKAGLLPMCNEGFAAIDEMNLMSEENQNVLQEAMENQSITKAKAVKIELSARCGILGAANPIYGRYDFDRTVLDNIKLAIPLLNRFDIRWNIIDKIDEVEDTAIAAHLLSYYANPQDILNKCPFSKIDLIKYFNYVRTTEPKIGVEARKAITNFVNKVRKTTKDKHSIPVDKRIIESMTRLCVARAKLLLKNEVTQADIDFISDLYLQSLESFGIDTKTELTQNKFFDTRELNQEQTFWKIYTECMDEEQSVDMVQVIEKLACTKLFDEFRAKSFFEKQIARRKLYELKSGRWKKVD